MRQAEIDAGARGGVSTEEHEETPGCTVRRRSSRRRACFRRGARPGPAEVSAFIDERRCDFGVEPICRILDVSASAYYQRQTGERSARAVEDERLLELIKTTHERNYLAYRYRRMCQPLLRAGESVPRCWVQRLMRTHAIVGAKRRGKPWRTTKTDTAGVRHPIWSIAISRRRVRTRCGWGTSRICVAGRGSCSSAS